MAQLVYYPTRIAKNGVYKFSYCKVCKSDELHLVKFHKNDISKQIIEYDKFCETCFDKWTNKQDVAKQFNGEVETLFYGEMCEATYQQWNEMIKWG